MRDRNFIRIAVLAILEIATALLAEGLLGVFLDDISPAARITRVMLVLLTLHVVHAFALRSLSKYQVRELREISTLYSVLMLSLFVIGIGKILGLGLISYLETHSGLKGVTDQDLFFAIPYAVGPLMLQAVLGRHFSLVFSLDMALLAALFSPHQILAFPYVLVTSLVASISLFKFRSRSAYLKAGLNVGLIAVPVAMASVVLHDQNDMMIAFFTVASAFLSGILAAFLGAGLTPFLEYICGFATDMRLIEIATLDHALLKELSVQAPGTWNHSMVMGMMVESAADSVGANSVVCRVGAYFHDIGKTKKPLYFVENQEPGENRHSKLSSSMSALIIRSHVKDGIELARKHKIPPVIEDMILQHHGTSLIEYFYEKACTEAEESGEGRESVDASLYTYPGPKPQTREAGILMLADGIEAAARTLSDPTHDRIQGMVQKMINKVFASGQLDECELTLKDLHLIAKSFTRVLTGIYHQRVAYAEPAEKINEGRKNEEEANGTHESEEMEHSGSGKRQKGNGDDRSGKEDSGEDLKRLGI